MNTDVAELLREGMERFTRDLRAPTGMTQRAARRRRRRVTLCSVAGGAAALTAGAVALAAVVFPGTDDTSQSGVLTAYVVKRVDSALRAVEPGEIAQMTITRSAAIPGGKTATTTAEEWSYGDQWRSVTNSSAGHPVYDEGFGSSSVYTLVNYLTRTWARQPGLGRPAAPEIGLPYAPLIGRTFVPPLGLSSVPPFGLSHVPTLGLPSAPPAGRSFAPAFGPRHALRFVPPGCNPVIHGTPALFQPGLPGIAFSVLPGIGFAASALPTASALCSAISCGTLTVAGRQRVDGIDAIELTSRRGSLIAETIWVSPGTYLPVRMVVRSAFGSGGVQQTADITWLPPTSQNLAMLTVPIPAGFRQVALAKAVEPILEHIPFGLPMKARSLCLAGPGLPGSNCFTFHPPAS